MMKKVLVIDDDQSILDAVKFLLEDSGYTVETMVNADNVRDKVLSYKPAIILLDMLISGGDGRDVSKLLKKNIDTSSIPVVMIAAHPQLKYEAPRCGADDFLAKPFDIQDLLAKVAKYTSS